MKPQNSDGDEKVAVPIQERTNTPLTLTLSQNSAEISNLFFWVKCLLGPQKKKKNKIRKMGEVNHSTICVNSNCICCFIS